MRISLCADVKKGENAVKLKVNIDCTRIRQSRHNFLSVCRQEPCSHCDGIVGADGYGSQRSRIIATSGSFLKRYDTKNNEHILIATLET